MYKKLREYIEESNNIVFFGGAGVSTERKMIIELICNEQTHMIIKDHTKYDSDKYKKLEKLKVKIKDA